MLRYVLNYSDLRVLGALVSMASTVLKIPRCWTPGQSNVVVDSTYSRNMLLIVEDSQAMIHNMLIEIT